MKRRHFIIGGSLWLAQSLAGCSGFEEPEITIPEGDQKEPETQEEEPTTESPEFSYIEAGEGQQFLAQPVFFITWNQDKSFYEKIPETALNWRPEWRVGGILTDSSREQIEWFHERGIHYIGNQLAAMHQWDREPLVMKEHAAVDIEGEPIHVSKPGMGDFASEQYFMNILDPAWQDILLEQAKESIDAGIEGIILEDVQIQSTGLIFEQNGSFDPYSLTGFREYLEANYSTNELEQKFDISNSSAFDFRDYLRSRGLQQTWNKERYPPIPITAAFKRFQYQASVEFYNRFAREVKRYADDEYGRHAFFSVNASPQFVTHVMPAHEMDYLAGEHVYFHRGTEVPKAAVVAKLAEAFTNHPVLLAEVAHDGGRVASTTKELFKYVFADMYSADATVIVDGSRFMTLDGWTYVDPIEYDVAEARKYVNFAKRHPDLYGLEKPAEVAVVHSMPSRRAGSGLMSVTGDPPASDTSIKGTLELLMALNIPFDVLQSGDDVIPGELSAEELAGYEVVVFPGTFMLNDAEVTVVLEFVRAGGTAISLLDFGTHDKSGNRADRAELEPFKDDGEHRLGDGSWFTIGESLGNSFYLRIVDGKHVAYRPTERSPDDPSLVRFRTILEQYHVPEIRTDAPLTVDIHRYVRDDTVVLHIANYDYDQVADEFTPTDPLGITVALPAEAVPERATVYDFEKAAVSEHPVDVIDGSVTVTVPSVHAYTVVEL